MSEARMKHGSETFFIEGEGVLTTQVGGRSGEEADPVSESESPRAAAPLALAADVAPPFRFSRVGPKGTALGATATKKLARAMVVGGGGAGDVPAGYTYLGQFIDHDLTMDRTDVMFGDDVRPVDLLQGRSPRLDLDSLYGNGPGDAASAKFYAGRPAPEDRYDDRDLTRPGEGRARPAARGHRAEQGRQAQGADPRPAQRREPGRRADPPGDDPLPQRGRRQGARVGAGGREVHPGPQAGHPALPVDGPARLPAAHLRHRRPRRRVHERPQARRAGCGADVDPDHARGVLGRRFPARAQHDPGVVQLEPALPRATPGRSTSCSRSRAPAATCSATSGCPATGSPTGGGCTTSRPAGAPGSRHRAETSTTPCGSTAG